MKAAKGIFALSVLIGGAVLSVSLVQDDETPGPGPTPAPSSGPAALRVVERARMANGLSFSGNREEYADHCYPGTPHNVALSLAASQSSCLLHARGCLAEAGIDGAMAFRGMRLDGLRVSYEGAMIGSVETLLFELAKQRGALVLVGAEKPDISPGDIVVIGTGGSPPPDEAAKLQWLADWGGIAHGCVVVALNGDSLICVDGGQSDAGNGNRPTAIDTVIRRLEERGGRWWLGNRKVNYIIKTGRL